MHVPDTLEGMLHHADYIGQTAGKLAEELVTAVDNATTRLHDLNLENQKLQNLVYPLMDVRKALDGPSVTMAR